MAIVICTSEEVPVKDEIKQFWNEARHGGFVAFPKDGRLGISEFPKENLKAVVKILSRAPRPWVAQFYERLACKEDLGPGPSLLKVGNGTIVAVAFEGSTVSGDRLIEYLKMLVHDPLSDPGILSLLKAELFSSSAVIMASENGVDMLFHGQTGHYSRLQHVKTNNLFGIYDTRDQPRTWKYAKTVNRNYATVTAREFPKCKVCDNKCVSSYDERMYDELGSCMKCSFTRAHKGVEQLSLTDGKEAT